MKRKITILGGGVAGSALAFFLAEKGLDVNLYEKGETLGGLSRSIWNDHSKCWNDIGPHIFHSPDEEITELWLNLFSDIFQIKDYYSAVIKGKNFNQFHPYPINKEGIELIGEIDSSSIDLKAISVKDQAMAKNFREMMIAKVGNELEKAYFRDYPEKLWGMPTNQMRADWAPKRLSIKEKIETFFCGQFVATSKKGAGHVYRRIENLIKEKNCKIHFESEIKSLRLKNGKVQSINVNGEDVQTSENILISTIPVPIIASFLGIKINLKYRGVKISNWITSKRNLLPNDYGWVYFDDESIPFTRITDYTKMSPYAISNDKGIITAECPFDPGSSNINEEKLNHLNQVKLNLESIPWLKGKIIECSSFFNEPYVYPIREQGFENELNIFNNKISRIDNLWSLGAAGGFEYSDSQILFRKAKDFSEDLASDLFESTNRLIGKKEKFNNLHTFKSGYKLIEKPDPNKKTKIISEIGINHNGSLDLAKKLIEESKLSGADFVKFQFYRPEKRASVNIRDDFYSERADGEGESLRDLFESCYLSRNDLQVLKNFADNLGIEMFLSAFDSESVLEAAMINPNLIKISSMDLTNIEVWEASTKYFKKIIASTGMSSLEDVKRSYEYAINRGNQDLTLLHCVSSYPMPIEEANLGRMNLLRKLTPNVGYSDHSTTVEIPYTAALMGATVIEKHFTLDKSLKGPDHIHSATPAEMKRLVKLINSKSEIMDTSIFAISKIQKAEMMKQKKGYFYVSNLNKGDILEKKDMKLGAPCIGSDTFECYTMIGKELKFDVKANQAILTNHFKV